MKKMLIIPALLVITLFFSLTDLDAARVSGCIDSGTSLKGKVKIGSKLVGSNYYYSFSDNTYQESTPVINFCTDTLTSADPPENTGTISINYTVDYCINGDNPILNIWSSYFNNVDYTYSLGYSMHLGEESWTYSPCFRSFISLKMNYVTSASVSSDLSSTTLSISGVKFGMYANFGYSAILRYTDLVYYNSTDYNAALIEAKKIGQSQQTNNKLNDLNNKQDQTNGKLEDLNKNLKSDEIDDNSGFFSNFTSSDHGLAGIITSPLRAINKLTSACQPVSFNVLEEPIELPCGDTLFWNKEDVQSFRLIWNILVGGPILFLLLKKLFKVVENLKNPDDDRIEVLDL